MRYYSDQQMCRNWVPFTNDVYLLAGLIMVDQRRHQQNHGTFSTHVHFSGVLSQGAMTSISCYITLVISLYVFICIYNAIIVRYFSEQLAKNGYHLKMTFLATVDDHWRNGITFSNTRHTFDICSFSGCTLDGGPNLYNLVLVISIKISYMQIHEYMLICAA